MIAAARRFVRFGECAAHHDRVCATGQRFANVATSTHPSIGDDRHVTQCFFEVSVTRRRAIDRRGNLRNTKSKHAARSASRPGSDADQNRRWPTLHDLEGHVVANSISDDYRDTHFTAKLFKSSDLYCAEICRTVETVLCTTKTSAPASSAILPNSAAR